MAEQQPAEPPVGSVVRDTRNGRIGRVMPRLIAAILRGPDQPHLITLRPVHGGIEWDVPIEHAELIEEPDEPETTR